MHPLDWIVIAAYFTLLLGLAWWVILRSKNTADDYFLAGRHLGWFVIGASIFACNIGSEHLVGLAGSGATDGVTLAHYELHAWCVLVLAWVFVPFYARSKIFTTPEFLEKRFSPQNRLLLSLISLFAYVLTKIAVGIFAGGVVYGALLPETHLDIGPIHLDAFWVGSILVVLLTGLYTVLGGMRTVAYTEALQTFIFIFGSACVTIFGIKAVGGWHHLREICGPEMFNLWKPLVPAGVHATWSPVEVTDNSGQVVQQAWYFNKNYPWIGMLFCAPIVGLWYWCTDQYIVQRALGAPNETQARRGSIFAGMLKLLPVFLFIIPGIICFALAKSGIKPELHDGLFTGDHVDRFKAQAAFPLIVKNVLPRGIRGLVVAGLLAALMSSLAGVFNASSTLFTIDFYSKFRPRATQAELVWTGRMATVAMVLISLVWIPVVRGQKGLYDYLQNVQAYLAPPIFAVFFLGVFFKRLNAAGCLWALIVGFILGVFRLAVDTPVALKMAGLENGYASGSLLWIIYKINFQYFSVVIFLASAAVMIGVSYATRAPDYAKISGLTYGTITTQDRLESRRSYSWRDVAGTALVLCAILAAYIYFNG